MRGVAVAVVVVVQLALALPVRAEDVPFVALDPSDKTLVIEARGCGSPDAAEPSCSSLAIALGRQAGRSVRGFDQVTATLPSGLRTNCDVKPDQIGWPATWIRCFDEADTEQREWLTQGLGGTDEWRTGETPGGNDHFLIATWCWRGSEGFPGTDFCDPGEPVKRTRISLIDLQRNAYRNVELVEPYIEHRPDGTDSVATRSLLIHAGGAAVAGRWLYVADTDWLYVFNLGHFLQDGTGPYQLPVWARYVIADGGDRDRYNPFSSISVDGSSGAPRLVAAEYRLNPWSDAIVTVWPLQQDGRLPGRRRIESLRAYTIDGESVIDNVQGVASAGDLFLFSQSSNRIDRAPAGMRRRAEDRCIRWGAGTGEDLYASPARDIVAGINESSPRTGSAFWAVSYRQAFKLTPAPKGYPRREC